MNVKCDKCGTTNQIDEERIQGETAQIQCVSCKSSITVSKAGGGRKKDRPGARASSSGAEKGAIAEVASHKGGFGLRGKMFILFFFVPICLVMGASYIYLNAMRNLSQLITQESSQVVTKIAEETVAEKARSVAREVTLYLQTHPNLQRQDFNKDPQFKATVIQKIGKTGYTLLVSREDANGQSFMWVHPKDALVGIDIIAAMQKTLGPDYERWYKVQGKETEMSGYYMWIDKQEKFQHAVPIPGTDLNIVGTVYLGEFTEPMQELEKRATAMTAQATRNGILVLAITAVLIAVFVIFYSYRLSGRLKTLSDAADRISVGDLDVEIRETKSADEIGDLTRDLSRMQTSIRLAIKRLRERR
jgi:HAMP domain-containing protein